MTKVLYIDDDEQLRRDLPGLPIIAVSGSSSRSPDWLRVATRLGAQRALTKPFGMAQLIEAIVRTVQARLRLRSFLTNSGMHPSSAPPTQYR